MKLFPYRNQLIFNVHYTFCKVFAGTSCPPTSEPLRVYTSHTRDYSL